MEDRNDPETAKPGRKPKTGLTVLHGGGKGEPPQAEQPKPKRGRPPKARATVLEPAEIKPPLVEIVKRARKLAADELKGVQSGYESTAGCYEAYLEVKVLPPKDALGVLSELLPEGANDFPRGAKTLNAALAVVFGLPRTIPASLPLAEKDRLHAENASLKSKITQRAASIKAAEQAGIEPLDFAKWVRSVGGFKGAAKLLKPDGPEAERRMEREDAIRAEIYAEIQARLEHDPEPDLPPGSLTLAVILTNEAGDQHLLAFAGEREEYINLDPWPTLKKLFKAH